MERIAIGKRLHQPEPLFGTLMTAYTPLWPQLAVDLELDFVFLDMEHIPTDRASTAMQCSLYQALGIAPLVRISDADPAKARMMLDAGASGIIVPYIETIEQLETMVGAVKRRPVQGRALDRLQKEGIYPSDEMAAYVSGYNDHNALIINIESTTALENLEGLLEYEGLDAVLIGPHDLSCSLGVPEQYTHPLCLEAVEYVIREARKRGVGAGYHKGFFDHGIELEKRFMEMGMNLVVHEADSIAVMKHLQEDLSGLRTKNERMKSNTEQIF